MSLDIWRSPEFRRLLSVYVWLGSINAGFWIMARGIGACLDVFSELFWEDLWSVVAILYNVALAVFFSAIIFVSATNGSPPDDLLWRQGGGFVLLYVALNGAYVSPKTHELDEYSRPGFAVGLAAYILFAAVPRLVAYPQLLELIKVMKSLADSWLGFVLSTFMTVGLIFRLVQYGMREMFYQLAPFMWYVGLLRLPPIRVRRG